MRTGLATTYLMLWRCLLVACQASPEPAATSQAITPPRPTPTSANKQIADHAQRVEMVFVPAGEFPMGSEVGDGDERPVHTVYLDAYYIDMYEVTNARYRQCADAGVCTPPTDVASPTRSSYYDNPEFDEFTVMFVSWYMARTYCSWRGTELPTEAQWEKAARGTDGRTFAWGEEIDCQHANYYRQEGIEFVDCVGDTTRIGSYENGRSPYGAYDMTGNVWEWVADWYGNIYYQNSPASNPMGPETGRDRIVRG